MMSNPTWDWWFGDAPVRFSLRWMRTGEVLRRHRRRWIAAMITGTGLTLFAGAAWVKADEAWSIESSPVRVAPVTFSMLEDDLNDKLKVGENGGRSNTLPEPSREDVQRRERLRELLKEDRDKEEKPSSSDDDRRQRLKDLLEDRTKPDSTDDKKSDLQKLDPSKLERAPSTDSSGQFSEPFLKERLPDVIGGAFVLPSLQAVSTATGPIGNGRMPDDFAADEQLRVLPLPEDAYSRGLLAAGTLLPWAAPNTYSHPLYFEDRMLERHGHERWGCMQPIAAGARFFTTLPMLPYLATIQEPCDTVYSNGYFRAGSPAPLLYQRPPLERRAVIVEAAAISGAIIALP